MLILLIGAKGGVGTTSLARCLARDGRGVGLDLSDGQLAARLERRTWSLAGLLFDGNARGAVDQIVKRRISLLWSPECKLDPDAVRGMVRAVADRSLVVADGGIEPVEEVAELADVVIVVTAKGADEDEASRTNSLVAQYHVHRLKRRFPEAVVTPYSREVAQHLTEQLLQRR
ncbi:MAG: hypothetical protein GY719_04100 [bacterium]|nr:hypothetical protein [bacterium]